MGVDIDPAGGDQQAVRVDLAPAGAGLAADRGDLAVIDRDIASKGLRAGAVEDGAAANDDIMHLASPGKSLAQHEPGGTAAQSLAPHGPMPQRRAPAAREDAMSERQRVAIVTGAAGGIGRELVLGLLGQGAAVAAVDRTGEG